MAASDQDAAALPAQALGDSAVRGTRTTLLAQAVRVALQLASVTLLARLLTPEDFGLVAMVTAVLGVAEILRDSGLSSAAIQARHLSRDEQTNLFWLNTTLGAGCALLALLAAPLVVSAYGDARLGPIVEVLAVVFLLNGVATQFRADLARSLRFTALAVSDVAAQAAGVVVALVLAAAGWGVLALVMQQVTTAVVACATNAVNADFRPGLPRRGVPLGRFVRFGGGLLATRTISYATQNIDNVALGLVAGAGPLGLYSRAYQLLMAPLAQINTPLSRVAVPLLSRAYSTPRDYQRYLARAQLAGCYLTATVFAVAAGLSQPLVLVLFGSGWERVAPIFAVLAVGGIFRAVQQLAYWMYVSSGRTGRQLQLYLVVQPVMVACILAGLPWGAVGVAAGHSVGYALFWATSLRHAGRAASTPVGELYRNALRALALVAVPAGLAAALANLVDAPPVPQVALGLLFAAAYAGAVGLLVPSVRADARVVVALGRRFTTRTAR